MSNKKIIEWETLDKSGDSIKWSVDCQGNLRSDDGYFVTGAHGVPSVVVDLLARLVERNEELEGVAAAAEWIG